MALKFYNNTLSENDNVKMYKDTSAVKMYGSTVWSKKAEVWETLFTGPAEFSESGSLNISGISSNDVVDITADITFCEYKEDCEPIFENVTITRKLLPTIVGFDDSNLSFSLGVGQILFDFNYMYFELKGVYTVIGPYKLVIREVRKRK